MSRWLEMRAPVDVVVAGALAILTWPFVAAVAAAIRLDSPGPGVIALTRIGRGGRPFSLHKLRSMRVPAPGSAEGEPITLANDARITPLGRRLRRVRLDELPQLIDVVRGDMALIGPRPETPEYVDMDDVRWRRVLRVRPGIAGPTQLVVEAWEAELQGEWGTTVYRDEVLPVKLAVDEWYVANASPLIDLLVVWSLVERFLLGREVTAIQRRVAREVPGTARPGYFGVPMRSATWQR